MRIPRRLNNSRIETATVVSNKEPNRSTIVFELYFDEFRSRVTQCVDDCFSADSINLFFDSPCQCSTFTLNKDSEPDVATRRNFVLQAH